MTGEKKAKDEEFESRLRYIFHPEVTNMLKE